MPTEVDCRLTVTSTSRKAVERFYAQLFAKGFDPDRPLDITTPFAAANIIAISLHYPESPQTPIVEIDYTADLGAKPNFEDAVQTLRRVYPKLTLTLTHDQQESE